MDYPIAIFGDQLKPSRVLDKQAATLKGTNLWLI
jgi:hypothetical protein